MAENKRILITGGAGFIGSHLCERFLAEEYEVICVDNFLTGSRRNIASFEDNKRFRLIEHNMSHALVIQDSLDYVLHFASPASPIDYMNFPIPTLKVGALGTHNALGLAKAKRAAFLLASTSEVYGDPLIHPQKEDYWGNVNPVGPRGVYDEAKRFAEAMTMAYHNAHGMNTKIIRIFNTYGPRMRLRDGRAIPEFISAALRGEDIPVFGDGSQTRSFCFVTDLVEGIYRVLLSNENTPVNLGNPNEMSILRLAETIIQMTGCKSRICFKPLPTDDPKVRQPDISKAKRLVGWSPVVGLEDGLSKTIEYFRDRLQSESHEPAS